MSFDIMFIILMVSPVLIGVFAIAFLCRAVVRYKRAKRWCCAHPGILIGDDAFFKWCAENGVKPELFFP